MSDQALHKLYTVGAISCLVTGVLCCLLRIYHLWKGQRVTRDPLRSFAGIAILMCLDVSLSISVLATMEGNVNMRYGGASFFACQILYLMASTVYRAMAMGTLGMVFSTSGDFSKLSIFLVGISISVSTASAVTYSVLFYPLSTQPAISHARFWYVTCGFTIICEVVDGFCIIFATLIRPSMDFARFKTWPSTSLPRGRKRRTLLGKITSLGLIGASATRIHLARKHQLGTWDTGASELFLLMTALEMTCATISYSLQAWIVLIAQIMTSLRTGDAAEMLPPPARLANTSRHVNTGSNIPSPSESLESILGDNNEVI